jgi:hypothetical protein
MVIFTVHWRPLPHTIKKSLRLFKSSCFCFYLGTHEKVLQEKSNFIALRLHVYHTNFSLFIL